VALKGDVTVLAGTVERHKGRARCSTPSATSACRTIRWGCGGAGRSSSVPWSCATCC